MQIYVRTPSLAFEVKTCKFYHELIPKAAKMKILYKRDNSMKVPEVWQECRVNEAWGEFWVTDVIMHKAY